MTMPATEAASGVRWASGWIRSARFDTLGILLPPTLSLLVGAALSGTAFGTERFDWNGSEVTAAQLVTGAVVHAHLVAVGFRSHGNPAIFRRHPVRFVVVPVLLLVAMLASRSVFLVAAVVATFWDVYHSGLQTFGFARIYDARVGNDPAEGRWLDWGLNHVLYAGPILAGASLVEHLEAFEALEPLNPRAAAWLPAFFELNQPRYGPVVAAVGAAYLAFYVWRWWRLAVAGHRVSVQKVALLASTGAVSVYTWGFDSWGQAFLVMNLFHALQYFAIVWAFEGEAFGRRVGLAQLGRGATLTAFLGLVLGYGALVELNSFYAFAAFSLVVSLMHFWYDSFVWSVRRRDV